MQAKDKVSRQTIYKGKVLDLGKEQLTLPNGGAVALALDNEQGVCLLRQYRHATAGWIWELPGGRIEQGEDALVTVTRELREEAGITAGNWTALSSFYSTPGFCDERLYLFIAQDLQTGQAETEQDELLEVHWIPVDEALAYCRSGQIVDAKTLVGLYQLNEWLIK